MGNYSEKDSFKMQTLNKISDDVQKQQGSAYFRKLAPPFVNQNLRKKYQERDYQQEAFGRFDYYWNTYKNNQDTLPLQLLFHMATGSGKTLVMAGLIIYLYEKGYRNFLFFVNSNNIIDKTRDNFLNAHSSKYLFSDQLSIDEKKFQIKEAGNFQSSEKDNVNIFFTTIQALHSRINTPKENAVTFEDFEDKKIVLISDEAHHINAETKKRDEISADEKEELISWEGTVNKIFNSHPQNILLEFTATVDWSVPQIKKKYSDKLIFDYPLKQFRKDGYSKEVKVLQTDRPPAERALQAVLLSQYRRKIFEKNKIPAKPVILFKSKTIKESQAFFIEFISLIKNLKSGNIQNILHSNAEKPFPEFLNYLKAHHISFENLAEELKEDFSAGKLISVNSKEESVEKQLAVNSLEDDNNQYRAVFAVDKLNEGWDVLNLFDIVRLYNSKEVQQGKPARTTMAEAQLIGRGARYLPFQISKSQPLFKRKYDHDVDNELRVCEELYYHSPYNPPYIHELNNALVQIGIKAERGEKNKQTPLIKNKKPGLKTVKEQLQLLIKKKYNFSLPTGFSSAENMFEFTGNEEKKTKKKKFYLTDFGEPVIRKAINKLEFYQFANLKYYFPSLLSISEFIRSEKYLRQTIVEIKGLPEQLNNLTAHRKLEACLYVLKELSLALHPILMSKREIVIL